MAEETRVPRHPQFSGLRERIESLRSFPRDRNQSRNELADAGFFYTGPGDHVVCFFCGGGIHSWKYDDRPWDEHFLYYPHCHFVQSRYDRIRQSNSQQPGESSNRSREPSASYGDIADEHHMSRPDPNRAPNGQLIGVHREANRYEIRRPQTGLGIQAGAAVGEHDRGESQTNHLFTAHQQGHDTPTREQARSDTRDITPSPPKPRTRRTGKPNEGHFVIRKMKQMGFHEHVMQKTIELLQRTNDLVEIDAEEVINLILDARGGITYSAFLERTRTCSGHQSPTQDLTSFGRETLISVPEEDGRSLVVPCASGANSAPHGDWPLEHLQRQYRNCNILQGINKLEETSSSNGKEHQSENESNLPVSDNIPLEPRGATASQQLNPEDAATSDSIGSEDVSSRESPAILSIRYMGYNDQIIEPALQRLRNRNSKYTMI